jgi:hypothetical protein
LAHITPALALTVPATISDLYSGVQKKKKNERKPAKKKKKLRRVHAVEARRLGVINRGDVLKREIQDRPHGIDHWRIQSFANICI